MYSKVYLFSSALFAISFLCFIVAVLGNAFGVFWFFSGCAHAENLMFDLNGFLNEFKQHTSFHDAMCDGSICSACAKSGRETLVLLVIAAINSFLAVVLSAFLSFKPRQNVQYAGLCLAISVCVFPIIGYFLIFHQCFNQWWRKECSFAFYGPGALLTIFGTSLSWLATMMQILVAVDCIFRLRAT
jgi:hypothetical protein